MCIPHKEVCTGWIRTKTASGDQRDAAHFPVYASSTAFKWQVWSGQTTFAAPPMAAAYITVAREV